MNNSTDREALADVANPLGLEGVEFVEYATTRPQALGQVLEMLGFHPVARHRSREVTLYRQGGINVIVNAHGAAGDAGRPDRTFIAAVAFRVRDAACAYRYALDRGAWAIPTQVEVMELNIPAVHGVGHSRIYFVDRWREFSIYDVDFIPIPQAAPQPASLCGLHLFGLVQYIGPDRMADWMAFYTQLFGFALLPEDRQFGILPKGRILRSPCGSFYLQLIEPPVDALDADEGEELHRLGLGTADVLNAVAELERRGIDFVASPRIVSDHRGALTRTLAGGVAFELVSSSQTPGAAPAMA